MGRFFIILFDFLRKRRLLFLLILFATIALILWSVMKLNLVEDISRVIPYNEKVEKYLEVINQSAFADQMVIYIGQEDTSNAAQPDELIAYARNLSDSVKSLIPSLVKDFRDQPADTLMRGVYNDFYDNLPLFMEEADYPKLDSMTSGPAIDRSIESGLKILNSPAGFAMKDYFLRDPLGLTRLGLAKTDPLKPGDEYRTYHGYIFSNDLRYLIMFLTPEQRATETRKNAILMNRLDQFFLHLDALHQGKVKAGYFGSAAVSVANAHQLKHDIIVTMSLAIVLLILFIALFFGNFMVIPAITLTTLLSAGMSMVVLSLTRQEISAMSLGFGAVLLGIAIAYTIHYLNHLKDIRDPKKVLKEIALPIVMSSIISAGDFFTLLLVRSEAVRDMGLFAGYSILAAGLFTLLILPHLTKKLKWDHTGNNFVKRGLTGMASFPLEKYRVIPLSIIILTVVFAFTSKKISFESDMTGMSYVPEKLRNAEATLEKISHYTLRSVYVVTSGRNLDDALKNNQLLADQVKSLTETGIVKKVTSVQGVAMSSDVQEERIARWKAYWTEDKKEILKSRLIEAGKRSGFKTNTFDNFFSWLYSDFRPVSPESMPGIHDAMLKPYLSVKDDMATVTTILKVRQEDKPTVYQSLNTLENTFIFDKQFLTSTFMDILNDDFNKLVLISLLIVFVVLWLSYGRIELTLITFVPMFISWIWTLGIMGLLGIKLNIFNIIITSFVFGLGIDYGIFSIQGMLQEYKTGAKHIISYRTSVLMDAITTLIGLGVLVLAVHPALKSMAIAAIIGILSVWFVTWSLEPILFRWLVYNEGRRRPIPVNLKDFVLSIFALCIFIIGTLILTIFGLIFIKLNPFGKKWAKDFLHYGLMISSRVIIYSQVFSPKNIIRTAGEDFKKPAVIISNHQSHIDIALTLMLHPKLIMITNDRVQRSRFYGLIVRMADFHAASEGMDSLVENLKEKIKDGYSILIFPEGTRSPDTHIQRFHKGAFYLAEQFDLDIQPIILHGSGPVMTKGEYFLKAGFGIIKILPRIRPDDPAFGTTLQEKARAFRKYYIEEYGKVARQNETPGYYREKLVKNYLYKGPVLEWYLKIKVRLEKNYELFHEHLPVEGQITDIGCGYGFMAYMLHFLSPGRIITGIDYDAEKIAVANHCPAKNDKIEFVCGDVLEMPLQVSQAFILADILHYLPEEKQESLINKCTANLETNGVIIIREGDSKMRKRHLGTQVSEFFSTRTGFNQTTDSKKKLHFTSREKIVEMLTKNNLEVKIIDQARITSNLLYIAKKTDTRNTKPLTHNLEPGTWNLEQ